MEDSTLQVCPFHRLKCKEIEKNRKDIDEMKDKLATKADLKEIKDAVEKKMPLWALASFILIGMGVSTYFTYDLRANAREVKTINLNVSTLKANQDLLLRAFNITPLEPEKPKEVKENDEHDE